LAQRNVPLLSIANYLAVDVATAAHAYLKLTPQHLADAAAAIEVDLHGGRHAHRA
jgi:hypothetical protein